MPYDSYKGLRVVIDAGVAQVTLDNPPVNMLDTTLINELHDFVGAVREDERVRVIVVQSADPDFFVAHVDLGFMLKPETFAELANPDAGTGGDESLINPMQKLMLRLRALPQVTIAKLAGRLRGGGNELAMALDMRFAAPVDLARPARDEDGHHPRRRRHPAAAPRWWAEPGLWK